MLKISKYKKKLKFAVIFSPILVAGILGAIHIKENHFSSAVSATDFQAGRIIDDEIFYNKNTMTVAQIQAWLDRQIGTCDTHGTKPASDYGRSDLTRKQYAKQVWGIDTPFVCLNVYHENPTTKETSFERGGGAFSGGISAAQIIYNAAQKYGINPQVLLALLKKESAGPLTNDDWAIKRQYQYAMGYACPDSGANYSAACESSKAGFYNQMELAAWQLDYYRKNSDSYHLKLGWNNIQYAPDPACGTKRVYIENVATLSLYIYTPYTPNDAALANYPGTANCGAYGNRNFFMFFNQLFGSSLVYKAKYSAMTVPRALIAKRQVSKINPETGRAIANQVIAKGQIVEYSSRTTTKDGKLCLRTKSNTATNSNMCVLYSELEEIPEYVVEYSAMTVPRALIAKRQVSKINPETGRAIANQVIAKGQIVEYSSRTTTKDGKLCLRTKSNTATNSNMCVLYSELEEIPETEETATPDLIE